MSHATYKLKENPYTVICVCGQHFSSIREYMFHYETKNEIDTRK